MKLLLDTNVVLDLLLERERWFDQASALLDAIEAGRVESFLTATSLTTIAYFARKERSAEEARRLVRICLDQFSLIDVDRKVVEDAYQLAGRDFEDDIQIACAIRHSLDAIVTRDEGGGFDASPVRVFRPEALTTYLKTHAPPTLDPDASQSDSDVFPRTEGEQAQ